MFQKMMKFSSNSTVNVNVVVVKIFQSVKPRARKSRAFL